MAFQQLHERQRYRMEVLENALFRQEDFSLNLLFYCKQLQHLRDVQREAAQEAESAPAIATEPHADNCENEEREESSSSSYDGDLSEQDDAPLLGGVSVAFNKATQVKPKVKSRKSQAVVGECRTKTENKSFAEAKWEITLSEGEVERSSQTNKSKS